MVFVKPAPRAEPVLCPGGTQITPHLKWGVVTLPVTELVRCMATEKKEKKMVMETIKCYNEL